MSNLWSGPDHADPVRIRCGTVLPCFSFKFSCCLPHVIFPSCWSDSYRFDPLFHLILASIRRLGTYMGLARLGVNIQPGFFLHRQDILLALLPEAFLFLSPEFLSLGSPAFGHVLPLPRWQLQNACCPFSLHKLQPFAPGFRHPFPVLVPPPQQLLNLVTRLLNMLRYISGRLFSS